MPVAPGSAVLLQTPGLRHGRTQEVGPAPRGAALPMHGGQQRGSEQRRGILPLTEGQQSPGLQRRERRGRRRAPGDTVLGSHARWEEQVWPCRGASWQEQSFGLAQNPAGHALLGS